MSSLDLSGVEAKIVRAHRHASALDDAVGFYGKTNAGGIKAITEDDGRCHISIFELYREPDTVEWGVLLGDSVHNFRSALDHLIHAVARAILKTREYRKVEGDLAYPICNSERLFNEAVARAQLDCLGPRVLKEIERRQPYETHDIPNQAPLAVMKWLDDRDKHRLVHPLVLGTIPRQAEITITPPVASYQIIPQPGPFASGDEVNRILLSEPRRERDVRVKVDFALQIVIEESARTDDARHVLLEIGQYVQRIVAEVAAVWSYV